MKKAALVGVLLLAATLQAQAQTYAHCLLDKLPGTTNQAVFYAVYQQCGREFPSGFKGVARSSGKGFFGYSDGAQCTIKKASGTTHHQSAHVIGVACRCLYDENPFDQFGFKRTYCAD